MRRTAILVLAAAACGGSTPAQPDAGPPDAMPYKPAPHPPLPQVASFGGPVVTSPKVVPIWFTGDSDYQMANDQFLTAFTATDDWNQMVGEYGVGPLTIAPDIVTTDPVPTQVPDLESWLVTMTDGTHAGWPTPDGNTIYTVFLPQGAVLTDVDGSHNCLSWYGYHYETPVSADGLIYAVVARCARPNNYLDWLTSIETHELVEATTDPRFSSMPAWRSMDAAHAVNRIAPGAETGDMCEDLQSANSRIVGTYEIQRTWSNASAAADHDPCVPRPARPFVAATPVLTDDVRVPTSEGLVPSKGVIVPIGGSKTVELDLWADAPTGDFNVIPIQVPTRSDGQQELNVTIDKSTGQNGDKLTLTIQKLAPGGIGGSLVRVVTQVAGDDVSDAWIYVQD